MENCDVDRRILADVSQIFHHLLFVISVADVDRLYQKSRSLDACLVFVELHVERKWISRVKPILKDYESVRASMNIEI